MPLTSTFSHCAMGRMGIWQASTVHILGQSTRTPGPPGTRNLVLIINHIATKFADTLALVLGNQGPAIEHFKTLLSPGAQSASSQGNFVVRQTGKH